MRLGSQSSKTSEMNGVNISYVYSIYTIYYNQPREKGIYMNNIYGTDVYNELARSKIRMIIQ